MKNNLVAFILLAIIVIFLSGCTDENINSPAFNLNDIYRGQLELSLDQAITYEGNLTLKVDGRKYSDDILILGVGEHVLEAYIRNNLKRSEEVTTTITIIEEDNKKYIDVYSEPNINSGVMAIEKINSLKMVEEDDYIYGFVNGELVRWKKMYLSDYRKGYIIIDYNSFSSVFDYGNIVLQLDNGEEIVFSEELTDCFYDISDSLSQYGYFVIQIIDGGSSKINDESSIIVDSRTGKRYETLYEYSFSPSGQKVLTYNRWLGFFDEGKVIQVLSVDENEINYEWTDKWNDFDRNARIYIDDVIWINEDTIQYTKGRRVNNQWYRYIEVTEMLNYENGEWKIDRLDNQEKINVV